MSSRNMSEFEMTRRKLIGDARSALTDAMSRFVGDDGLTPMEWLDVLAGMQWRLIASGLRLDWYDVQNADE